LLVRNGPKVRRAEILPAGIAKSGCSARGVGAARQERRSGVWESELATTPAFANFDDYLSRLQMYRITN
jgi:hypothetical protein